MCDNTLENQILIYNLDPYEQYHADDILIDGLDEGSHNIRLVIDALTQVEEEYENDNSYEVDIYCSPPTIDVTGQLFYKDLKLQPPNNTFPMRDILVQLWDDDGINGQVWSMLRQAQHDN